MLDHRFWFILTMLMVLAGQCSALEFVGDRIKINDHVQRFDAKEFEFPLERSVLDKYLSQLNSVQELNDNQPNYVFVVDLKNAGSRNEVLIEISGSIVDEIDLFVYDDHELVYFDVNGYFYPRDHQSYLFTVPIIKGSTYRLVFKLTSRYFSGPVNFHAEIEEDYQARSTNFFAIVYTCLGGMIFLGLYNLLLYVGVKDSSYFFYSLYLFCTVVAWSSVFAILTKHFDVNEVGYALLPFYLGQLFSVLFYVRFLNLNIDDNPNLLRISYVLVFVDAIYLIIFPWLDNYYVYYKSLMHISSVWLVVTLFAGCYRLYQGFVPARFFVLGFFMIAVGAVISILPGLGIDTGIEDFYLVTLICQALDMLFLAIALADRINLLRQEKEQALNHAYKKDMEILDVEQQANHALIESNLKLKEALDISEQETQKKQNFLMVASHELKTPLNAMVQTANDLNVSSSEGLIVRQGVERLALVVDEVTLFSQLSTGDMKAVKNTVDVNRLLQEIVSVQSVLSDDLNIEIECPGDQVIEQDRYLVSIVLKSLIDNACKYSSYGRVKVSFEYDGEAESAFWCIEDNGDGLDLNRIQQLIEPFEQGSQGFSRQKEGLGLGLYVVKHAVEVMNGTIRFEQSEQYGGAKVTLTVPAKKIAAQEVCRFDFKTALVVEDNPVNAVVLTSILEKIGLKADVVENGQEALNIVKGNHYDVIFMDLQMPIMDGFEATRRLMLQAYPSPIVAVTAESESGSRERCFNLGMAEVILKPVRLNDIKECLERLKG